MRYKNPHLEEYRRLEMEANDQRRGLDFQAALASLFEQAHFRVSENSGAARPRQTDLFAVRGQESYLVEAKWRKRKVADVGDIDSLVARLNRVESAVVGLFFSVSGFSAEAIRHVVDHRRQPILLFGRDEIERLFEGAADLSEMLRLKRDHLLVQGKVHLEPEPMSRPLGPRRRTAVHPLDGYFILGNGERAEWLTCQGDFGQFLFADELPDVDWVPASGTGVVLDLSLPSERQTDLLQAIERLAAIGWTSDSGRWSIKQSTVNWFGVGAYDFAKAIRSWKDRYTEVATLHHTEEVCYQDVAQDGFYTLTADISASEDRHTWHAELSLQLIGAPLDSNPVQNLAESLHVTEPAYFRSLGERSVQGRRLYRDEDIVLTPVGFYIEEDPGELRSSHPLWTTAVVVRNPWFGNRTGKSTGAPDEDWVPLISQCEVLICGLRSHHPADEIKDRYFLSRYEWSWTSNALVFRPIADWD